MGIRDVSKYIKTKTNANFIIPYNIVANQHIVYDGNEMLFRYCSAIFNNMTFDDLPDEALELNTWDLVDYLILINQGEIIEAMIRGLKRYPNSTHITFIIDGDDRIGLTDNNDVIGGRFDVWEIPNLTNLETDVYKTLPEDQEQADVSQDIGYDYHETQSMDKTHNDQQGTQLTKPDITSINMKDETIMKRIKKKQIETKMVKSNKPISLGRLFRITTQAKMLLHYLVEQVTDMNLSIIYAKEEADFFLALYCNEGKAFACMTTDSDQLAYGVDLQILKADYDGLHVRYTPQILKELDINKQQLRQWCILLGCDYNTRIKGMGPVTSLKVVKGLKAAPNNEDLQQIARYNECWDIFSSAQGFEYKGGLNYFVTPEYVESVIKPFIPINF